MNDNFNLDDLFEESDDTTRQAVTFGVLAFGGLILLFSAITTYMFFSTYAGAVGAFVGDATLAPIVAGVIGVILLDAGAFVWAFARSHHATTSQQMTAALIASLFAFALSLATSALYVALSSTFEVGVYDTAGNLTTLGQRLQYAGIGVVTSALIVNFAALYAYSAKSRATEQATRNTKLRALVGAGKHKADTARAELVTRRTLADILEALPSLADEVAAANSGRYIERTLGTTHAHHAPERYYPPASDAIGRERVDSGQRYGFPHDAAQNAHHAAHKATPEGGEDEERPTRGKVA